MNKIELLKENKLLKELPLIIREINVGSYNAKLINFHILPGHSTGLHLEHIHHFVELHIPLTGLAEICWGGKTDSFGPGQFTITIPGESHSWRVIKPQFNAHIIWFEVKCRDTSGNSPEHLLGQLLSPQKRVFDISEHYKTYYKQIINELSEHKHGYANCVGNIVENLLIDFARVVSSDSLISYGLPQVEIVDDQVAIYINKFIDDNYHRDINLSEMANMFNMSVRHLSRYYKTVTGTTIFKRLQEIRLLKAEEMLRETNLQVKAVAIKCGYSHLSHFASEFKKRFGETPSDYRTRIFGEAIESGGGTQFLFGVK